MNIEASAEVGAALPILTVSGKLRFKCADEQGAMLVLKHDATREALHPCKDLKQYIAHNHDHWYRFARDVCRLDIPQDDILFVSGWVKTAEWALAAVTHRAREGEIVFGGEFGPLAKAAFSVGGAQETSISVEHRCGPKRAPAPAQCASGGAIQEVMPGGMRNGHQTQPPDLKHDQCIFLHYYKLKRRRVFAPKVIRAASAEPSLNRSPSPEDKTDADVSLRDADGETSLADKTPDFSLDEFEIDAIPARGHPESFDPVDELLNYILDETDASCAIASDEDVRRLGFGEDDLCNISNLLALHKPELTVAHGVGMLSSSDPDHEIFTSTSLPYVPNVLAPTVYTAGPRRKRSSPISPNRPRSRWASRVRSRSCSPLPGSLPDLRLPSPKSQQRLLDSIPENAMQSNHAYPHYFPAAIPLTSSPSGGEPGIVSSPLLASGDTWLPQIASGRRQREPTSEDAQVDDNEDGSEEQPYNSGLASASPPGMTGFTSQHHSSGYYRVSTTQLCGMSSVPPGPGRTPHSPPPAAHPHAHGGRPTSMMQQQSSLLPSFNMRMHGSDAIVAHAATSSVSALDMSHPTNSYAYKSEESTYSAGKGKGRMRASYSGEKDRHGGSDVRPRKRIKRDQH